MDDGSSAFGLVSDCIHHSTRFDVRRGEKGLRARLARLAQVARKISTKIHLELTVNLADILSDMIATLRQFQRGFKKARQAADAGEEVEIIGHGKRYIFCLVKTPETKGLYGVARGLAKSKGSLLSTGEKWLSAE